jgi:uncharacterized alpha-E superfamily protein
MTPDPKLVEAVARALWDAHEERHDLTKEPWEDAGEFWQGVYREDARTALAAIAASGEWWVAPRDVSLRMMAAAVARNSDLVEPHVAVAWDDMRDAYLKDTGTAA